MVIVLIGCEIFQFSDHWDTRVFFTLFSSRMSSTKHFLWYFCIVHLLAPDKALAAPSGTFTFSDQSVVGQGAYTISNALAEKRLKVVKPRRSRISKDKATANITSLHPKGLGVPNPSTVSDLPGATDLVAAAGALTRASPPSPGVTNGAGTSSQAQSGVTLTPAGWQDENCILLYFYHLDVV